MTHPVMPECRGEKCRICGGQAHHKVGEEMSDGEPYPFRHNLTAYLCCWHFRQVMGGTGLDWCEPKAWDRTSRDLPPGPWTVERGFHPDEDEIRGVYDANGASVLSVTTNEGILPASEAVVEALRRLPEPARWSSSTSPA